MTTRENNDGPSSPPFTRLTLRREGLGPEEPVDGVPAYLSGPLRSWFTYWLQAMPVRPESLGLRLRLAWVMPYVPAAARADRNVVIEAAAEGLWHAASREGGQGLLDMIDLALHDAFPPESTLPTKHGELTALLGAILRDGGSMWRPTPNGDSLEQRVSDDIHTLFTPTTDQGSPAAGTHLQEAWRSTYGLHPDPSRAYAEAIRAVESAAIPLVTPNDGKATLGTIRGQLRSQAKDFEFAIVPTAVGPVIDAISALWEGQCDGSSLFRVGSEG